MGFEEKSVRLCTRKNFNIRYTIKISMGTSIFLEDSDHQLESYRCDPFYAETSAAKKPMFWTSDYNVEAKKHYRITVSGIRFVSMSTGNEPR